MIKGVSRYAVEIDKTDSPFFEKVICFVRPQYTEGNTIDLHREAARLVNNLSSGVENAQEGDHHVIKVSKQDKSKNCKHTDCRSNSKNINWVPMAISAGGGAIAALVINAIL